MANAATYCSENTNDPHYIKATSSSYYGFNSSLIKIEICAHGTNECVSVGSLPSYNTHSILSFSKSEYFSAIKKGVLITSATLLVGGVLVSYFDTIPFLAEPPDFPLLLGFGLSAFGANLIVKNVESLQPSRNARLGNTGVKIWINSDGKGECLKVLEAKTAVEVIARQLGEKLDIIERENAENK